MTPASAASARTPPITPLGAARLGRCAHLDAEPPRSRCRALEAARGVESRARKNERELAYRLVRSVRVLCHRCRLLLVTLVADDYHGAVATRHHLVRNAPEYQRA